MSFGERRRRQAMAGDLFTYAREVPTIDAATPQLVPAYQLRRVAAGGDVEEMDNTNLDSCFLGAASCPYTPLFPRGPRRERVEVTLSALSLSETRADRPSAGSSRRRIRRGGRGRRRSPHAITRGPTASLVIRDRRFQDVRESLNRLTRTQEVPIPLVDFVLYETRHRGMITSFIEMAHSQADREDLRTIKEHLLREGFPVRESAVTRGILALGRTLNFQKAYIARRLDENNERVLRWNELDDTASVNRTVSHNINFFCFFVSKLITLTLSPSDLPACTTLLVDAGPASVCLGLARTQHSRLRFLERVLGADNR